MDSRGQFRHVVFEVAPINVLYLPSLQDEQGDLPSGGSPQYPAPQMQSLAFVAPKLEVFEPSEHFKHEVCPMEAWNLPMSHSLHEWIPTWPNSSLYFPAGQAVHAPSPSRYWPVSHLQSVISALPATDVEPSGQARHSLLLLTEYVPALQGTHAETLIDASMRTCLPAAHWAHASSPVTSLNVPAGHLTHGPPAGPVCPRLQTQSASTLLPATATEPAGQCMHAELFLAATMVEYFPLSHSVQAAAPDDTLNLPAVQAKHIPPSGPV